jgi:TP53 regulating kinase-like protein
MMTSNTNTESKAWYGPPPPPELTDNASSLRLLSQGAEARVWLATIDVSSGAISEASNTSSGDGSNKRSVNVGSGITVPQLSSLSQHPSPLSDESSSSSSSQSVKVIVKERFPKKYRHPALDVSLTKSRTKGEARSLIRCKRAEVACPNVLAIANWSNIKDEAVNADKKSKNTGNNVSTTSACLFIEHVQGCTVRQYFEQRLESDTKQKSPSTKRQRLEEGDNTELEFKQQDRVTTVIDTHTLSVAYKIGTLVGKMHAAGVVHGDLTTSNIMVTNPPPQTDIIQETEQPWEANLVLIDFGLATSTNSTILTADSASNNDASNSKKPHKKQHSAEEKAVDLYVLERAFLSTHPESEPLVEEVLKGYREFFEGLGSNTGGGGSNEGTYGHVAKAIFNRLEQVRMRGRKRECFG